MAAQIAQSEQLIAGRYRLGTVVGSGGMGQVWRAHDELLDREVAVKEIPVPAQGGREAQAQIVREARAAARLDHPNVVRVYDVVQQTDRSWIVMEYVPGRSLHDLVLRDGPISHRQAARFGLAVLSALRTAHAAGVVHRDVKPQNVLVDAAGRAVLTDFGLATVTRDPGAAGAGGPEALLGSPHYVAPERLLNQASGPATDLWSLGATLYAVVEGRAPFARDTVAESLVALATDEPDEPRHPGPLHEVIAGLLVKDPERRTGLDAAHAAIRDVVNRNVGVSSVPASRRPRVVDEVRFAPATVAAQAPVPGSAPVTRAPDRRVQILFAVAGVTVALAGAAGAAVAATRNGTTPRPTASTAVAAPVCAGTTGRSPAAVIDTTTPYALPEGWGWHRDPAGFRLPLPQGWNRSAGGTSVCFSDPDGLRSFTVDTAAPVTRMPLQYWQQAEKAANLPGYERVSMDVLLLRSGGADWEYTWQPAAGQRQHVRRLLLATSPTRSYLLQWTTRDENWASTRDDEQRIVKGFA